MLFLSDILPTGYMGAEMCDITARRRRRGVGRRAGRAVRHGQRAGARARRRSSRSTRSRTGWRWRPRPATTTIDFEQIDVRSALLELTGGRGPDKCIDAVGMEATHGAHARSWPTTGPSRRPGWRPTGRTRCARRSCRCRSGGIVSVIGVYGGFIDKFPAGAWMNRALTLRTGQCHVQRYMQPLLERIERRRDRPDADHHPPAPAEQAPHGYDIFKHKQDGCEKVVLKP